MNSAAMTLEFDPNQLQQLPTDEELLKLIVQQQPLIELKQEVVKYQRYRANGAGVVRFTLTLSQKASTRTRLERWAASVTGGVARQLRVSLPMRSSKNCCGNSGRLKFA
jgi:hypothetical protein